MSERLKTLAAQLSSFPAPSGESDAAKIQMLKVFGEGLASSLEGTAPRDQKIEVLQSTKAMLARISGSPWDKHEIVVLIRKMVACGEAIVEGKPEPTEAELQKLEKSAGCFIATAVYGTEQAEDVAKLRNFRDRVLRQTWLGSAFILFYETLSPPLANLISKSAIARCVVRNVAVRPAARMADYILGH